MSHVQTWMNGTALVLGVDGDILDIFEEHINKSIVAVYLLTSSFVALVLGSVYHLV